MRESGPWPSIASVTPTLCGLFRIPPPYLSDSAPLTEVLEQATRLLDGRGAQRILVFAPDALGSHLLRGHASKFDVVRARAPIEVSLRSIVPSVTPVCFASMFTGTTPDRHGLATYQKPVLMCDTLFDALVRAGLRAAIVAVRDSSIDKIFHDRPIDYFSESYDPEVLSRALALVKEDRHDFILVYQQEYDDVMHATTPESPPALEAVDRHVESFRLLVEATRRHWSRHDVALAFTPDHGAHRDPSSGQGTHGKDIPDDMEVRHYFGLAARETP
jgi:predicted AlkP superfamily pyrophosphatase or phosphodiesterase